MRCEAFSADPPLLGSKRYPCWDLHRAFVTCVPPRFRALVRVVGSFPLCLQRQPLPSWDGTKGANGRLPMRNQEAGPPASLPRDCGIVARGKSRSVLDKRERERETIAVAGLGRR